MTRKFLSTIVAFSTVLAITSVPIATIVVTSASPAGAQSSCSQRLWTSYISLSQNDVNTERLVPIAYKTGKNGSNSTTVVAQYRAMVAEENKLVKAADLTADGCGVSN
jgi:hypothetical protein